MVPHTMSRRYGLYRVVKQICLHHREACQLHTSLSHCGSIDDSEPNQTAIYLAQVLAQEEIAQRIQAMYSFALTNPPMIEKSFNYTIQTWEEKLNGKLAMVVSTINLNMDKCMEATDTLKVQNHMYCYDCGSNGYKVPTFKPMPISYCTIFGCHPPKPFQPTTNQPPILPPSLAHKVIETIN